MTRFCTWNLENFFRPGDPAGPTDQGAYQAKLASLAAMVTSMAPDVLAVQEVGDPEALADLAAAVGGSWHLQTANPDGRGIRVGVMSRLSMSDVAQVSAFPAPMRAVQVDDASEGITAMGRPALSVRVVLDTGRAVDLVICHLKSKLLTYPGGRFSPHDEDERARFADYALSRRAAEAATVRAHATALLANQGGERALVVLGDLNDEPEAATTQLLQGPPGSEIGTAGYHRPDQGDGQRLWNLAARIPEANRYSRIYRGRPELIDHILASHVVTTQVATATSTSSALTHDPSMTTPTPNETHPPPTIGHSCSPSTYRPRSPAGVGHLMDIKPPRMTSRHWAVQRTPPSESAGQRHSPQRTA
jgi:endonuclease/exonuclease/phosphatase family metal-dependent hydrolase